MPLPTLDAGQLNNRVEFRRKQQTSDGKGGFVVTWPLLVTVWAEVQGQDGREAVIAQALQGISTYRIRIYYRGDITPDMQVRFSGIDFNIRSVSDPNGDREQLVILADTGSAQKTT